MYITIINPVKKSSEFAFHKALALDIIFVSFILKNY